MESQTFNVSRIESFLLCQYIASSTVQGFDENRKRREIFKSFLGGKSWDEMSKNPPDQMDFDSQKALSLTETQMRNTVELIRSTFDSSQVWNGAQAGFMLDLHDRLTDAMSRG